MKATGRRLALSPARQVIGDLMRASRAVPAIPMERRMSLAPLLAARAASPRRIGWCAIFTKAFAIVSARRPELRRSYLNFPYGQLFEHDQNIASIAVERRIDDEDAVLFALVREPDRLPLAEIQAEIDRVKTDPLPSIASYRRAHRFYPLPGPLRQFAWWFGLNVSGRQRAKHFGTFGVSSTAPLGASQLLVLSPLTTTLFYSPFDKSGSIDMRLVFDHRVLDGAPIARALADMEAVLLGEILAELSTSKPRLAA